MPQPAAIGRLAEQESPAIAVHVDSWVRRGRDYLQVLIVATAGAADVAEALDLAWRAFRKAAGDDAAGWDMARHATFPERARFPVVIRAARESALAVREGGGGYGIPNARCNGAADGGGRSGYGGAVEPPIPDLLGTVTITSAETAGGPCLRVSRDRDAPAGPGAAIPVVHRRFWLAPSGGMCVRTSGRAAVPTAGCRLAR
jgi:hypothetical protein